MNAQRFVRLLVLGLALAAVVVGPGLVSIAHAQDPVQEAAACSAPFKAKWLLKGNCASNPSIHFLGTLDSQPLIFKTNAAERMRIDANGNVGIGGVSTGIRLTVATPSESYGIVHTNGGTSLGTWVGQGSTGSQGGWFGTLTNHPLHFFTDNSTARMTLTTGGSLGIGTVFPSAKLEVLGKPANLTTIFRARANTNQTGFYITQDGSVHVEKFLGTSTLHVCQDSGFLSYCSSAAEYVPSIDGGRGYPETADLVSIAPQVKNPYGDKHGPFVVQKSTLACDPHLLGFIVKPESGADGPKLNDHYLPLAIYGYFPAKVTLENGPIKRGDPLTSSSKAGYAMKATDACKIIGYALEDATTEGQIQVLANAGENAASEVAELDVQMQEKDVQIAELKQQNAALEKRLSNLEQLVKTGGGVASLATVK